ncbi:MAG TPA: hypothetical protein DCP31_30465 [Cyanobacteria bacterium UBA8543]|nr:hypothetical protein [Cyanobacteria bacterium UBA8543]
MKTAILGNFGLVDTVELKNLLHLLLSLITMLSSLPVTVTFATTSLLLIANTAYSKPLTVSSNYPVVSNSDTNDLVCYMQTANGTTLNLSRLCENKPQPQPIVKTEVVISHVDYEDNFLIGNVVNKSSKTVHQARVNYEIIGENGSVMARGAMSTEPPTLRPGQTAKFQTLMPGGGNNVKTTSVEWDE